MVTKDFTPLRVYLNAEEQITQRNESRGHLDRLDRMLINGIYDEFI